MNLKVTSAIALLGFALSSGTANAAPINGSISFDDGFTPPITLVSLDAFFDINSANTDATAPTGSFSAFVVDGQDVTSAADIDTASPGGNIYVVGGFTFLLGGISNDTNTALTCVDGVCRDTRTLSLFGTVTGNMFDQTNWLGNWTANGSCLGANGACTGDYSASWSSSLSALGVREVAEPGTLALLGLGLVGLAGVRRRKA